MIIIDCTPKRQFKVNRKFCVLNFASAKNPGGGFLNGSMAQEESLAISSNLYYLIKDSPMYQLNRRDSLKGLYHHAMIYSPSVEIIRDDQGQLLEDKYSISVLSVPAVNWNHAISCGISISEIEKEIEQRMRYMLNVALMEGVENLILGSWGCGVFGGSIEFVAHKFIDLLTDDFQGCFDQISFTVLDKDHQKVFEDALDSKFS